MVFSEVAYCPLPAELKLRENTAQDDEKQLLKGIN